jgi:hypothetical protein
LTRWPSRSLRNFNATRHKEPSGRRARDVEPTIDDDPGSYQFPLRGQRSGSFGMPTSSNQAILIFTIE